jgi:hypothetical protein
MYKAASSSTGILPGLTNQLGLGKRRSSEEAKTEQFQNEPLNQTPTIYPLIEPPIQLIKPGMPLQPCEDADSEMMKKTKCEEG